VSQELRHLVQPFVPARTGTIRFALSASAGQDVRELLLDNHADVNAADDKGETPFASPH